MQRNFKRNLFSSTVTAGVVCSAMGSLAFAMSPEAYLEALKIADQHVSRLKSLEADTAGALSSSLVKELYGRYYEVGDSWEVAAVHIAPNKMRKTSDPAKLADQEKHAGVFRYEVKKVINGAEPEVLIEVTQLRAHGFAPVDGKVEKLVLRMSDKIVQSEKIYLIREQGELTRVAASPEGVRSNVSSLELLPLDVPEVRTARREQATGPLEIPASLHSAASSQAFAPDLKKGIWFDQDDFFGRPVEFLWEPGDPWPKYMKTPHGIAILLKKEGA